MAFVAGSINSAIQFAANATITGAQRFSYDYKDGDALAKRLYVAVCPFKCDVTSIARKDLETMGVVAYAEYVALANYAARFRRLPKYNDKKNSPKE